MPDAAELQLPALLESWEWLHADLLGNPVSSWVVAAVLFVVAVVVLSTLRSLLVRRTKRKSAERGRDRFALLLGLVSSISWLAVFALSLWLGLRFLDLEDGAETIARWVLVLAIAWQAIVWAGILVEALLSMFVASRVEHQDDQPLVASLGVFRFLAKLAAYTIVVLVALDNLGADVTALLAGLGVGGIAVALAVQNIVGDIFSSMSITLDKPFVIGDFIIVGDKLGTVENIGIKTTRVRSLAGEEIVFGNSDLLNSRIQNFKRMRERRVVFGIGVVYSTEREQVVAIPDMLRASVEAQEGARLDRVHFKSFGTFALEFEVVYYVNTPDYNAYMDIQQAINLEILERFEAAGVEFAFPTQTLHLQPQTLHLQRERDANEHARP